MIITLLLLCGCTPKSTYNERKVVSFIETKWSISDNEKFVTSIDKQIDQEIEKFKSSVLVNKIIEFDNYYVNMIKGKNLIVVSLYDEANEIIAEQIVKR